MAARTTSLAPVAIDPLAAVMCPSAIRWLPQA